MPLIICASCNRRVKVDKCARAARLRCSNCGALAARVVRKLKVSDHELGEGPGLEAEAARHATYAGLKWQQEQKGFKPGYVGAKFKTIFGRWPNGEAVEEAAPPSGELVKWLRSQGLAWAREQRKLEAAQLKPVVPEKPSALMTDEDWGDGFK